MTDEPGTALFPYRLGERVTLQQEGHTGAVTGTISTYMPLANGDWRVWLRNDSGLWACVSKGERPSVETNSNDI